MPESAQPDKSNGYDQLADLFKRMRNNRIGPSTVREWSNSLPPGCSILDLGCGNGVPISEVLIDAGFRVCGVDASANMIRAFRQRFPQSQAVCTAAEDLPFADCSFDAAIAWGLLFLLPPHLQEEVIRQAARVLKPGGRFLFTSPREEVRWNDSMTGLESISLGAEAYHRLLASEGLVVTGHASDEGDNYYFFSSKD